MAGLVALKFDVKPVNVYSAHQEYASCPLERAPNSNFLRGVKWSPDGACLLTASDDGCLRIYDTPLEAFEQAGFGQPAAGGADGEAPQAAGQRVPAQAPSAAAHGRHPGDDSLSPALRVQEGEQLYDYSWFSAMSAGDPASCCFATTGRAQPVHLWDALTGQLRCSYRVYNELDEVAPAHSLAFSPDGDRLFCGLNRRVAAFRVERPGRECQTLAAFKRGQEGLPGIVSCLAPNPDRSGMLAAGSFAGGAALLDSRSRELLCLMEGGHAGGLTHLCFSADGNFLYTGARRDPAILCWDVRYASGVVYSMQRASCGTNQRIYFDVEPCGRHLATGGEDGAVRVFDLRDGSLATQFSAATDTVNGVQFHPFLPLLATASGQRRYGLAPSDSDADSDGESGSGGSDVSSSSSSDNNGAVGQGAAQRASWALTPDENVLRIWQVPCSPADALDEAMPDVAGDGAAAGHEPNTVPVEYEDVEAGAA